MFLENEVNDCLFQPTHPCGVRLCHYCTDCLEDEVSTHAPLRGATSWQVIMVVQMRSFNPRTPAGCDGKVTQIVALLLDVSTHAPLRGATLAKSSLSMLKRVSTHAPLRGATLNLPVLLYFTGVSTHAPLRGATSEVCSCFGRSRFQPTHPCGVRLSL